MKEVLIPDPIRAALDQGAALCVSISGGKDSQALLSVCCRLHRAHRWKGDLVALHADLGRAEWPETSPHVRLIASRYRVPLTIVRWEKGDLLDRMENRRLKKEGDGEPFWPSPQSRYCTSDLKSDPLDKWLRRYPHLVSAHGIRAQESAQRAKKPWFCKHKEIGGERWLKDDTGAGRQAWVWNTIFHWRLEEVWEEIAVSPTDLDRRRELYRAGEVRRALYNWPAHPAYVYGNERLSCVLCILGSRNDLINGARHNPELYRWYVERERLSGFTFQHGKALGELFSQQDLLQEGGVEGDTEGTGESGGPF